MSKLLPQILSVLLIAFFFTLSSFCMKVPTLAALCCKKLAQEWSEIDVLDEEACENLNTFDELTPKNKEILTKELESYCDKPILRCMVPYNGKLSPDGKRVLVKNGGDELYDATTGEKVSSWPRNGMGRSKWSKAGLYIFTREDTTGDGDYRASIRSAYDGQLLHQFDFRPCTKIKFTVDDKNIIIKEMKRQHIIKDMKTGTVRAHLGNADDPYMIIAQDPMAQLIVLKVAANPGWIASFYDEATLRKIKDISGYIRSFNHDGSYFFVDDNERNGIFCYKRNFDLHRVFSGQGITNDMFYRKTDIHNKRLLVFGFNSEILFNFENGERVAKFKHDIDEKKVKRFHVGSDFSHAIVIEPVSKNKTKVAHLVNEDIQHQWEFDTRISTIQFTQDPKFIVLGYSGDTDCMINLESGQVFPLKSSGFFKPWKGKRSPLVSSDGKYLHERKQNNSYQTINEIWQLPGFNKENPKNPSLATIMACIVASHKAKNSMSLHFT